MLHKTLFWHRSSIHDLIFFTSCAWTNTLQNNYRHKYIFWDSWDVYMKCLKEILAKYLNIVSATYLTDAISAKCLKHTILRRVTYKNFSIKLPSKTESVNYLIKANKKLKTKNHFLHIPMIKCLVFLFWCLTYSSRIFFSMSLVNIIGSGNPTTLGKPLTYELHVFHLERRLVYKPAQMAIPALVWYCHLTCRKYLSALCSCLIQENLNYMTETRGIR